MYDFFSRDGGNVNNPYYTQFLKMSDFPSGREIFVFIEEHPDSINDLALLDIHVPNRSGFDILKRNGTVYLQQDGKLKGCWVMEIDEVFDAMIVPGLTMPSTSASTLFLTLGFSTTASTTMSTSSSCTIVAGSLTSWMPVRSQSRERLRSR